MEGMMSEKWDPHTPVPRREKIMFDLLAQVMRGIPTRNTRLQALDAAVMAEFPHVTCETRDMAGLDMESVTEWWREGTDREPLDGLDAWKVRLFVRRWLADRRESGGGDEA
jgi:hypothetical protein